MHRHLQSTLNSCCERSIKDSYLSGHDSFRVGGVKTAIYNAYTHMCLLNMPSPALKGGKRTTIVSSGSVPHRGGALLRDADDDHKQVAADHRPDRPARVSR